jgi:hypothetical protein
MSAAYSVREGYAGSMLALCLNVTNGKMLLASSVVMIVIETDIFKGICEKDKSF